MPAVPKLAKAELHQLDSKFEEVINESKSTKVQFNPDSLKVSFANQIATPPGAGDQNGPQGRQFVGAGTTKLTCMLYFDVTAELADLPQVDDVRELTKRVAYFITPAPDPPNQAKTYVPPAVRFIWGSFQFDGIMDSMEETLELFSAEGRPLRASVALALSQQKITFGFNKLENPPPPVTRKGGQAPGTTPITEAPAGSSLQSLAANLNGPGTAGGGWQAIASANGIENPRLLAPGQLINLNPPTVSGSFSTS